MDFIMNKYTIPVLFLAACMLSGCNQGDVTFKEAAPVQYEYKTVYTVRDSDSVSSLQDKFNEYGKAGWKFLGVCMVDGTNGRVVLFSRELRP